MSLLRFFSSKCATAVTYSASAMQRPKVIRAVGNCYWKSHIRCLNFSMPSAIHSRYDTISHASASTNTLWLPGRRAKGSLLRLGLGCFLRQILFVCFHKSLCCANGIIHSLDNGSEILIVCQLMCLKRTAANRLSPLLQAASCNSPWLSRALSGQRQAAPC